MSLLEGIPDGWTSKPLWSMFERVKDTGHPDETMLSVFREHGVVRKESRANFNVTADDRNIYQLVDPGWLVVNRMKAWQGAVGISPYRGIVSGHYICFRPVHDESPHYLNWLLRSDWYAGEYLRISRGVRPGQAEIDNDLLRRLPVLLPPRREQEQIADSLGGRVAHLDQMGEVHARLLQLLDERINSAIGEFIAPALTGATGHDVAPLRHHLRKLARPVVTTRDQVVTAFRDGQVIARSLRRAEGYTDSWTDGSVMQGVTVGDVVVHGLDGFSGAIGASESSGACSPANHVCQPLRGGDPDYYGRMLRILALSGYLSLYGGSSRERAVDFRNWASFSRIPLPVVSTSEQMRIGEMIRATRPLASEVRRLHALLAERKRALITAAVTGQFDVTTARSVSV